MRCRTQRMARGRSANLVIPLFLDSIACVTAVTLRPIVPQLTCITNIRSEPYLAKKLASDKQVMLFPSLLV
jgi:hypothetical protein